MFHREEDPLDPLTYVNIEIFALTLRHEGLTASGAVYC